jgi:catechol 2,3-dioxygenase-like lactoylglutathione lyase family enzyme
MAILKPIFRIFDYNKAVEFYVDWLGFQIDWEHTFDINSPIYMQVRFGDIVLHLSEHSGDCSPGARLLIEDFGDLKGYHTKLNAKNYKYNKPGIEVPFYDDTLLSMEVIDPFGNRITFTGKAN